MKITLLRLSRVILTLPGINKKKILRIFLKNSFGKSDILKSGTKERIL